VLPPATRKLQGLAEPRRTVVYQSGSARVTSALRTTCGPFVHTDSICHEVKAKYELVVNIAPGNNRRQLFTAPTGKLPVPSLTDESEIKRIYQVETYKAINDGTYYGVLKRQMPNTPLYIGTIPLNAKIEGPGSSNDDPVPGFQNTNWLWLILLAILALSVLLMLCAICARAYASLEGKTEENTQPTRRGSVATTVHLHHPRQGRRDPLRQSQVEQFEGELVDDDDSSYFSHYDDVEKFTHDNGSEYQREMKRQQQEIERELRAQQSFRAQEQRRYQ